MKRLILAALLATGIAGAAQADDALKAVIAGEHRAESNRARDVYRHPYETLTFFGIKPNMTVVELVPSGGWYTEILAPYLREKGKLIGAGEAIEPGKRYGQAFRKNSIRTRRCTTRWSRPCSNRPPATRSPRRTASTWCSPSATCTTGWAMATRR